MSIGSDTLSIFETAGEGVSAAGISVAVAAAAPSVLELAGTGVAGAVVCGAGAGAALGVSIVEATPDVS